jgi:hypothetical protein
LNELSNVTGIKLSQFDFEISFGIFTKAVIRALLNESSTITGPAQLHLNRPLE